MSGAITSFPDISGSILPLPRLAPSSRFCNQPSPADTTTLCESTAADAVVKALCLIIGKNALADGSRTSGDFVEDDTVPKTAHKGLNNPGKPNRARSAKRPRET